MSDETSDFRTSGTFLFCRHSTLPLHPMFHLHPGVPEYHNETYMRNASKPLKTLETVGTFLFCHQFPCIFSNTALPLNSFLHKNTKFLQMSKTFCRNFVVSYHFYTSPRGRSELPKCKAHRRSAPRRVHATYASKRFEEQHRRWVIMGGLATRWGQ